MTALKDAYEKAINQEDSDFNLLMASIDSNMGNPSPGDLVEGEVTGKTKAGYFVSIGQKSDSFLPFEYADELEIGDRRTFEVTDYPDEDGSCELSQQRAESWLALRTLVETGECVDAEVKSLSESREGRWSGLIVEIHGITGFIPRSQIVFNGKMESLKSLTTIPVVVLTAEPPKELVASNRKAIEKLVRNELGDMRVGATVGVEVYKVLARGILVRTGPYSVGYINNEEIPESESPEPGQKFDAKIMNISQKNSKIYLSRLATLQQEPFLQLAEGTILKGVVSKKVPYGVFVRLDKRVEGLLHFADHAPRSETNRKPESLSLGQTIDVALKRVDPESRQISLTRQF